MANFKILQCVARADPRRSLSLPEKRSESPRHIFYWLEGLNHWTTQSRDSVVHPMVRPATNKITVSGSIPGSDEEKNEEICEVGATERGCSGSIGSDDTRGYGAGSGDVGKELPRGMIP